MMFLAKSTCILLTTATIAEAFSPAAAGLTSLPITLTMNANANANGESCSSPLSQKSHRLPLHLLHMSTVAHTFQESSQSNDKAQIRANNGSVSVSINAHNRMNTNNSKSNSNSNSSTGSRSRSGTKIRRGTATAIANKKKKKKERINIEFEPKNNSSPALSCIEIFPTNNKKNHSMKDKKKSNNNSNGNRSISLGITPASSSSQSKRLLTREEENSLTQAIQTLKSVIQSGDELSCQSKKTSPNLLPYLPAITIPSEPSSFFQQQQQPSEQEWATACNMSIQQLRLTLLQGKGARTRLVSANIGLVMTIAKRYDYELEKSVQGGGGNGVGTILTLSDLVQEGNMGLMEAAERFDAEKGARFATYAGYWVKQRILRAITENSRVIRLPAHGALLLFDSLIVSRGTHSLHFIPLLIPLHYTTLPV